MSVTPLSNPAIRAPITMTTITPMATPKMVRAARSLCARSDVRAMPTPSRSGVTDSLLPQRGDGVEARRAAGGVHAGDDAEPAADRDAEHDRQRGDAGGQGRRRVEQQAEAHAGR